MELVLNKSMYSLLIYMILKKEWNESIFIIQDWKPLQKKDNIFYYKHTSLKENLILFYIEKIKLMIFLMKKKVLFNRKIKVYGNTSIFSYLFINRKKYILEHGTGEYLDNNLEKYSIFYNLILPIIRLENPMLRRNNCYDWAEKIYLTNFSKIPKRSKGKIEVIDLKKLWSQKTDEEKQEILQFFNFNQTNYNILKNKKYILFTQPLSEDKVLDENEKIELYKKIINNYNKNELIIKVHPREKTNYKNYFKDIEVIDSTFPAELLKLLNINFKKSITIFSTAGLTVNKGIEIDFYGTEIHPKILKKFGSMKDIFETNAVINDKE